MEGTKVPKRVVLRFSVKYELEEAAINERFFALFGPKPVDDFYSHLMASNSSKMHIVLDIHCKSSPLVDLQTIAYEVFKVRKNGDLYVSYRWPNIRLTEELVSSRSLTAPPAILLALAVIAVTTSAGALTDVIERKQTATVWRRGARLRPDPYLERQDRASPSAFHLEVYRLVDKDGLLLPDTGDS